MVKKLVKHGNSLALILDKPVLELLNINENTALKISTIDGQTLQISPSTEPSRSERIQASTAKNKKKFSKTLKNLAK